MANEHIVTFEKDIENEIRAKSASLSDIAAASGVVDNKPEKNALGWVIIVVISFVILAVGVVTYLYYTKLEQKSATKESSETKNEKTVAVFENNGDVPKRATTTTDVPKNTNLNGKRLITTPLSNLLPATFPYIQKNLVKAETFGSGYIITFTGYNETYKAILDNENLFLGDALLLYGDTAASTTTFLDIRVGDEDARVATGVKGKNVYYLFIKPSLLVIADTKETLQKISDAILK